MEIQVIRQHHPDKNMIILIIFEREMPKENAKVWNCNLRYLPNNCRIKNYYDKITINMALLFTNSKIYAPKHYCNLKITTEMC